jgi:hypothetical protein
LVKGVFNGTSLTTTPNMVKCLAASNILVIGAQNTWTAVTASDFTIAKIFDAFAIALDPVYHLADINFSCFVGA